VGLVFGKRAKFPTAPMILAASIGPMPKISTRAVPEASISSSMRSLRSAIFLSSVRTSRSTSEANHRRRRAGAPLGRMLRRRRAARWIESVPITPPGRRSRRSPCRRLSARVRSATRSISASSESRRSTSEPASGSTTASRSLREADRARWRGHRAHRSCGRCHSRASSPAPRAWAARSPQTRLRLPTSLLGDDRGRQRSPPPNDARGIVSPSVLKGSQAFSRFCGKLARSISSPTASSTTATATDTLWGSTPIKTFMRPRTSVPVGSLCRCRARKTFRLRAPASIPLLSHSAHRSLRRDASREQANPSYGRQEVAERSLYITGEISRPIDSRWRSSSLQLRAKVRK
jgi:hypothetical protein